MSRPLALVAAVALLSGCKAPPPSFDPFVGPSTVPPPSTKGATAQPPPDPYYRGITPHAAGAAPSTAPANSTTPAAPAASAPAATQPQQRAGPTYQFRQQTRLERSKAASAAADERRYGSAAIARQTRSVGRREETIAKAATPEQPAAEALVEKLDQHDAQARSPTDEDGTGSQSVAAEQIVARPSDSPAEADTRIATSESDAAAPAERQAGFTSRAGSSEKEPGRIAVDRAKPLNRSASTSGKTTADRDRSARAASVARGAESSRPQKAYGHDPQYRWLKGKLEYSQTERQWKLRYIPIDGKTDRHGGSVILSDSSLLDEYEPGMFIAVQGSIRENRLGATSFAPEYQVERIKPL